MEATRTPVPVRLRYQRIGTGHLLKLASDESLIDRVRAGDERAFAVIYERHFRVILAFCRHMLRSREEAEDVVQQTFVSAYRDMLRDDKELKLRPWLYRIARNHCISTLRRRRPEAELDADQPSVRGLAEEVSGRGELRALLADLARLPHDQREALVLAELHDNSHAEVAEILGCETEKVKSLVFQARSSLIKSREARDLSCDDVRLQLSSLKGSALRRGALGRHLEQCDGCRAFGAEVRRQRQQLAVLLAVVPTAALKLGASTAVAAASANTGGVAGIGSAAAAGSAPGAGAATGAGSLAAVTAKVAAPGMLLKGIATTAAVVVLAAGGAVGVQRVSDATRGGGGQAKSAGDTSGPDRSATGKGAGSGYSAARSHSDRRAAERRRARARNAGREHASTAPAAKALLHGSGRGASGRAGALRADRRSKARNQLERRGGRQGAIRRRYPERKTSVGHGRSPATGTPSERPASGLPDEYGGPTAP